MHLPEFKKIKGLLTVTFLDHFSINLIMPALVFIFFDTQSQLFPADTSQAVRAHWYGIVNSLPYFAAMIMTPLLSALSDRYGRKNILMIAALGALCFGICAGLSIVTGMLVILLIGKFTGGLCARSEPIALAAMMDISSPGRAVVNIGYLQVVISIGAFFGPIIGGYLAHFYFSVLNFSAPFWLASIVALSAFLAAKYLFNETYVPIKKPREKFSLMFKTAWALPDVKKLSCILILLQLAWSTYYQFFPPLLKQYLLYNAHQIGWFIGMIALWLTLTTSFGLSLFKKFFSNITLLKLSIATMILGMILTSIGLLLSHSAIFQISIWLGAALIATGDVAAYCILVSLLANCVDSTGQGKMMGYSFLLVYLAWGFSSLLSGAIGAISLFLPFAFAGASTLILGISMLIPNWVSSIGSVKK